MSSPLSCLAHPRDSILYEFVLSVAQICNTFKNFALICKKVILSIRSFLVFSLETLSQT